MTNLKVISRASAGHSAGDANEPLAHVTEPKIDVASTRAADATAARTPEPSKPKAAVRGTGAPLYVQINRALTLLGLTWFVPFVNLFAGQNPRAQLRAMWLMIGVPAVFFAIFLALWGWSASQIHTSLGTIPGPAQVAVEA
ncbi:MAG: hypothetical protein WBN82_01185, partial [Porticoccaceae bacterium]